MTPRQQKVLNWFRAYNVGSMRVGANWVWPEDIRSDPELASRVWNAIRDPWMRQHQIELRAA